jgi:hypothetical protein
MAFFRSSPLETDASLSLRDNEVLQVVREQRYFGHPPP